jgi:hypothetical protein
MGILVAVLATSAADRNFGLNHSVLLILVMFLGAALGFVAGAALSRDYYKRDSGDKHGPVS